MDFQNDDLLFDLIWLIDWLIYVLFFYSLSEAKNDKNNKKITCDWEMQKMTFLLFIIVKIWILFSPPLRFEDPTASSCSASGDDEKSGARCSNMKKSLYMWKKKILYWCWSSWSRETNTWLILCARLNFHSWFDVSFWFFTKYVEVSSTTRMIYHVSAIKGTFFCLILVDSRITINVRMY